MSEVQPIVRFEGVQKSYDGHSLVVQDLDLDVASGEFLTLLGPSGSGKTTTLMMLAGFESPTEGSIRLMGQEITGLPAHERGIGMVFQNYALFPHMTVADNIAYPLRVRRVAKAEIESRVRRALEMVRLEAFGERRPSQLSGGQQQRVALARALVFEPPLVLLDEPLGALDKQLREEMQLELKQIHEELGVTMIYVTHDQSEALTMSDRVAVFHEGRIQQLASAVELYERPANAFVAQFVGENNRLHGTVQRVEGEAAHVQLEDGTTILAHLVQRLDPGAAVDISLRPERVRLIADGAAPLDNALDGRIDKLVYLGDLTRLFVRVGPILLISAKVANDRGIVGIERGDPVRIGWRTIDARAFPAGQPA
jgi:putative spermidine/putrescine transport system ATP-binding protein